MPRNAGMSVEQAVAEIGKPHGSLFVKSDNRKAVRQWLVAMGVPAEQAYRLPNWALADAYNKHHSDKTALLVFCCKHAQKAVNPVEDAEEVQEGNATPADIAGPIVPDNAPAATPAPQRAPSRVIPPGDVLVPNGPVPDAVQLLRELLLQGYQPKAAIDENRVRAIVQESLAGIAPRVLEIRHGDREPVRIDGLVHAEFERTVKYLSQRGPNGYQCNVMLVGPAGCGKSHLIGQVSRALTGGDDNHTIIGGTAGATEADFIGRLLPGDGGRFEYIQSRAIQLYQRGNAVIGLDEVDGFDANCVMVMNMPLANGSWYVHLDRVNPEKRRGENVYFIATANTFGTGANPMFVGRNPMDEATRDRFIFISVDYDHRLEEAIGVAGGLSASEMAGIWELRDRTREAELLRCISTRAFQKAAVMKACGDSWREIRDRLTEGWTRDEKAKVGV